MPNSNESELLALDVQRVCHSYGQHRALHDLELNVGPGEIFALLGPNGSGKTTLFRLISTLAVLQQGDIQIFGASVRKDQAAVRSMLGVVFQSPSLDPKLTVAENIRCQAALYGLSGKELANRIDEVSTQLGIQDRSNTRTDELSGGLKRRVELAKGILHKPKLLLMDEPSTGLDPASRLDLWHAVKELRHNSGVTVLLTTHLLEEADKADRIAILNEGAAVAIGKPNDLRASLGAQVLGIQTTAQEEVLEWLSAKDIETQVVSQQIRVMGTQAASIVEPLSSQFSERIQTITLGQPSLEDVFIERTGHQFWHQGVENG